MSKEAALRAMREARFNDRAARATSPSKPAAPVAPMARPARTQAAAAAPVAPVPATDALCGHRSMNGRSCTREQGHIAKSHRYS